jgi:hypothetical protein
MTESHNITLHTHDSHVLCMPNEIKCCMHGEYQCIPICISTNRLHIKYNTYIN